ncbi:MAG: hypothetical protein FWC15_05175 [Fibromonadales bacterium]|nr:hypothetical protein [Fibromonadales bacterium]
MNKIEKALAKLFHAIGEEKEKKPAEAEISAFMVKYMAFLEMQSFPGNTAEKFFAMGAAAAHRQLQKPPGGQKKRSPGCRKEQPPRGKTLAKEKPAKRITAKRGSFKSTNWSREDFENDDCEEEDYE